MKNGCPNPEKNQKKLEDGDRIQTKYIFLKIKLNFPMNKLISEN